MMHKKLIILIPAILVVLLGAAAAVLFSGSRSFSAGYFLRGTEGQCLWITSSGEPVRLTLSTSLAQKSAEKLKTGDKILLLHDGILESYPAQTGCYLLLKTGKGEENAIPADTYDTLVSMGWLEDTRRVASETPEEESTTRPVPAETSDDGEADAALSFALDTFRAVYERNEGNNTLYSPLSLRLALGLTANGAAGETRSQLETLLGLDTAALNEELKNTAARVASGENAKLANALYVKKGVLTLSDAFTETAKAYYDAELSASALDAAAADDVNKWVKKHTDGKIEKIVDSFDENAAMVLLSALSFDADWQQQYAAANVRKGEFTSAAGRKQTAQMMYSTERSYLETETATGFIKRYSGGHYAFAALLPKQGESIASVLESLTPAALETLLSAPQSIPTDTAMPQFSFTNTLSLREPLTSLGMTNAFDPEAADFSALGALSPGAGNIAVDLILQKTFIEVTPAGTSAAAVTEEIMTTASMILDQQTVILDRPFLFLIYETENNTPLFLGAVNSVG